MELTECQGIGFQSISGGAKVKLLPSEWPNSQLPPTTASLLSISSSKGLLAAAGPDGLIVASTSNVRKAFLASSNENIKPITPELVIPNPRLSHVAFTADGAYLVISAEQGGGLAVYNVDELLKNIKEPAFQIATEGVAIRALAANPAPEYAEFVAVVLSNGHLMIANLRDRNFGSGVNNSPSLKDSVSSICWSNKGKQLVAGLADGTLYQMDPKGVGKAVIPRPPDLQGDQHGLQARSAHHHSH